jgi:hypothetical protein
VVTVTPKDRQERHEKAERENGGMSGGGRYIPVNSGYASPVIEKASLGERRGVRGALLRRDTTEAGKSTSLLLHPRRGYLTLSCLRSRYPQTRKYPLLPETSTRPRRLGVLAFETPLLAPLLLSKVCLAALAVLSALPRGRRAWVKAGYSTSRPATGNARPVRAIWLPVSSRDLEADPVGARLGGGVLQLSNRRMKIL